MKRLIIWAAAGAFWAGVLPLSQADAATVSITGGTLSKGFSGQDVLGPATGVTDPGGNQTEWHIGGSVSATVSDYIVDWYYLGAESGWTITFSGGAPVVTFTENEKDYHIPDLKIGTSTQLTPITFSPSGSIAYAYLLVSADLTSAVLTTTPTDWFIFAYNDKGSTDKDYDDYIGYAHVRATPIPAALPLMGTGLGIGYLMSKWARRRRSRQLAPAAA
jgi:hypothetical protein